MASPPVGKGDARPVKPSHKPFQLQRIGEIEFPKICVQVVGPEYGNMIQSKHPVPLSAPIENSKVPVEAMLTTIQVLFNSPDKRHPEFEEPGFVDGFDVEPFNSLTAPNPLGST